MSDKPQKELYEKLGLFYLGRDVDPESMEPTEILTLLKNKTFTTHAAIIGMTGSGKTWGSASWKRPPSTTSPPSSSTPRGIWATCC